VKSVNAWRRIINPKQVEDIENDEYGGYRFARWKPSELPENARNPSFFRIFIGVSINFFSIVLLLFGVCFVISLIDKQHSAFGTLYILCIGFIVNRRFWFDATPIKPTIEKPVDGAVPILCPRKSVPGWLYLLDGWIYFQSSRYSFRLKKSDFVMDEAPGSQMLGYEIGKYSISERFNLPPIRLQAVGRNMKERRYNQEQVDELLRSLLASEPPEGASVFPPILADPDIYSSRLSLYSSLFLSLVVGCYSVVAFIAYGSFLPIRSHTVLNAMIFGAVSTAVAATVNGLWPWLVGFWDRRNRLRLESL